MSDEPRSLIVLPDPQKASLPALVLACDRLDYLMRTDPPADLEMAIDLLDKLSAIETYLSKHDQEWAAQTPARRLEAHIGKLLGPGPGKGYDDLDSARGVHWQRRAEFRLMDKYRPPWEPALPLSRRAALTRIERFIHPAGDAPDVATGKRYGLVYADPPWPMPSGIEDRSMERHYPAMSIEAICAMPVADIVYDDALLYLWAISTHLHDAFHVIEAWGFEYVSSMVWVKDRPGTGWWVRHKHEYLLIGRRGKWSPPPFAMRPISVIEAPRTEHSAKPELVAEMLERLWPDVPRVELFRRGRARPGWDVAGDESVA